MTAVAVFFQSTRRERRLSPTSRSKIPLGDKTIIRRWYCCRTSGLYDMCTALLALKAASMHVVHQ